MNIDGLYVGMLVRDGERLLRVIKLGDDDAKCQVIMEGRPSKIPKQTSYVTYSPSGVWQFLGIPTDSQLESHAMLYRISLPNRGGYMVPSSVHIVGKPRTMKVEPKRFPVTPVAPFEVGTITDGDLAVGDPVSWKRTHYVVLGHVRDVKPNGWYVVESSSGMSVAAVSKENLMRRAVSC